VSRIPPYTAPHMSASHTITADIEVPAGGAEGVIIASGGRLGGFSLFVRDGHVIYENNAFGAAHDRIVASHPLLAGRAHIVFQLETRPAPDASPDIFGRRTVAGFGRLSLNGEVVGEANFAHFGGSGSGTLDIGKDLGTPVSADYAVPFAFTGKIETVKIDFK